jgi:tRNA threonylcarbamoyladenosine biosynthesis protein TsaE
MRPEELGNVHPSVGVGDLERIAKELVQRAGGIRVWIFHGAMGSGKTTFIKAIGHVLGVTDNMSSPTFAMVNEYLTRENKKIFHFDFYRIKNETEAYDIGTEEYFYSGNYCFIEWPEKIPSLIPPDYVEINISIENNTFRTIAISVHDGKKENWI